MQRHHTLLEDNGDEVRWTLADCRVIVGIINNGIMLVWKPGF